MRSPWRKRHHSTACAPITSRHDRSTLPWTTLFHRCCAKASSSGSAFPDGWSGACGGDKSSTAIYTPWPEPLSIIARSNSHHLGIVHLTHRSDPYYRHGNAGDPVILEVRLDSMYIIKKHRWHKTNAWGPWTIWRCMNWFVKTAATVQAQAQTTEKKKRKDDGTRAKVQLLKLWKRTEGRVRAELRNQGYSAPGPRSLCENANSCPRVLRRSATGRRRRTSDMK